jgi:hypothetical protein
MTTEISAEDRRLLDGVQKDRVERAYLKAHEASFALRDAANLLFLVRTALHPSDQDPLYERLSSAGKVVLAIVDEIGALRKALP